MTRCHKGDLAQFVPGSANAGRQVLVDAEELSDAYCCPCGKDCVIWVVQPLQTLIRDNGELSTMKSGLAPDCQLRPIRGEPNSTETLTDTPKEVAGDGVAHA